MIRPFYKVSKEKNLSKEWRANSVADRFNSNIAINLNHLLNSCCLSSKSSLTFSAFTAAMEEERRESNDIGTFLFSQLQCSMDCNVLKSR